MLYHDQVFGNVSERRESKCSGELMKHPRKVKGEHSPTTQQLKTKNINVARQQLFCRQCEAKLLSGTDSLY